jgi:hypothetical protein
MPEPSIEKTPVLNYTKECSIVMNNRQLAREHSTKAIDKNTKDHDKKAYLRQFHEGE